MPYFLYVQQGVSAPPQYVSGSGTVILDAAEAQIYTISQSGQLMNNEKYFSTSGLVPFEAFAIQSYAAVISTTFSNQNGMLVWSSPSFALGQAQFCLLGQVLEVAYDGYFPAGCTAVGVYLSPTSSIMSTISMIPTSTPSASSVSIGTAVSSTPTPPPSAPGSVHGSLAVADLVGCLMSPSTGPALNGIRQTTSTLEQCVDYCASYSYFGVQNGKYPKPLSRIKLTGSRKQLYLWQHSGG